MTRKRHTKISMLCTGPLIPFALWALAAIYFVYYFVLKSFSMHGVDFTVLWRAAYQLVHGAPVYQEPVIQVGPADHWEVFKYPQFLAMVFAWFARMPFERAELCWKLILSAAILAQWAIAWQWLREVEKEGRLATSQLRSAVTSHPAAFVAFSLAIFSPLSWSLQLGQVGPLLSLLLFLHFWLLRHKRDWLAGLFWALAILTKVLPVALGIYYLAYRRWRVLLSALGAMMAYLFMLVLIGRARDEWYYFTEVAPQIPELTRHVSRSLSHLAELLIATSSLLPPEPARYAGSIVLLLFAIAYSAIPFLFHRRGVRDDTAYAVAVVGLTLLSPTVEGHHFVILLPAVLLHASLWLRGDLRDGWGAGILLAWIPIATSTLFHQYATLLFVQFVPTLANAFLWLMTLVWALAYRPIGQTSAGEK